MLTWVCSNDYNMLGNVAFTVIPRGIWVWYLTKTLCETAMLSRSSAIMAFDEHRWWKTRKCIAIAIVPCHLVKSPRHISKNREFKGPCKRTQHVAPPCRVQHVAFVCTPCWAMLHDAGIRCVQFAQHMPTFLLFSGDRWARWLHSHIKSIVL